MSKKDADKQSNLADFECMQCNPSLPFLGEAIYEIGVEDNGLMTGLSDEDMDSSLDTLREMARRLGATIQVLRERVVTTEHGTRTVSEVLVRKVGTYCT